jgi:hypothetical protein
MSENKNAAPVATEIYVATLFQHIPQPREVTYEAGVLEAHRDYLIRSIRCALVTNQLFFSFRGPLEEVLFDALFDRKFAAFTLDGDPSDTFFVLPGVDAAILRYERGVDCRFTQIYSRRKFPFVHCDDQPPQMVRMSEEATKLTLSSLSPEEKKRIEEGEYGGEETSEEETQQGLSFVDCEAMFNNFGQPVVVRSPGESILGESVVGDESMRVDCGDNRERTKPRIEAEDFGEDATECGQ